MTITAKDYAVLDKDSYKTHKPHDKIAIHGAVYEVIDYYNDPVTGFRGTAYQRTDTHEVVIANRGTETDGEGKWQGIATDAGMVIAGLNAQMPDARMFAHRVKAKVEEDAIAKNYPIPPITVTGHSLGGAITEILAYEMHWQGVTFNGYGAVDMGYHIPEGGSQVTNYVRVTDVVSAASHHFGKVIELATPGDIEQLRAAGYTDHVTSSDLRNPFRALSFAAHGINNFAPKNPDLTPSDLSPANEARARAHSQAVNLFREDVQSLRANTLSLPWELLQKKDTARHLAAEVLSATLHGDFHKAGAIADLAGHRATVNAGHALSTAANTAMLGITAVDHTGAHIANQLKQGAADVAYGVQRAGHDIGRVLDTASHSVQESVTDATAATQRSLHDVNQALDAALAHMQSTIERLNHNRYEATPLPSVPRLHASRLDEVAHPDHAMYQQAREGVHKIDAEFGRVPDQRSDQLAAALVVAARREGLTRIDAIHLHAEGSKVLAKEHPAPDADWTKDLLNPKRSYAIVPTVESLNTPIAQSSQQWEQTMQQNQVEQAQAHERQLAQQQTQQENSTRQASQGFSR